MELVKEDTGLGDLELADAYNAHWGAMVGGPLTDKHLAGLKVALAARVPESPRNAR